MAVATFDTLKYAKALRAAGVTEQEADAHVDALKELMQSQLGQLATKDDLKHLAEQLRNEINEMKQGLSGDNRETDQKLTTIIRETDQRLTNSLHETEQKLTNMIRESEQRIRGELTLLRWMVGSLGFGILAILIRLFVSKSPF
jgi:DNA anti-recombination protein RmuC